MTYGHVTMPLRLPTFLRVTPKKLGSLEASLRALYMYMYMYSARRLASRLPSPFCMEKAFASGLLVFLTFAVTFKKPFCMEKTVLHQAFWSF